MRNPNDEFNLLMDRPHWQPWSGGESDCEEVAPESEHKPPEWAEALQQGMDILAHKFDSRERQFATVGNLMSRVAALEERAADASMLVPIQTFAPEPFELLKQIMAVVQPVDDEYSASFFDANISATGCNESEAIDNLKETILSHFDYLDNEPATKLGPSLLKQLAVLREFVRRRV